MPDGPPTTADDLRSEIVRRYEGLSKRLQQIARYILDQPNDVALETLAVIAQQLSQDERLAEAALPSLAIVVIGILPVVLISRLLQRRPLPG